MVDAEGGDGEDGDGEEQADDDAAAVGAVALVVWVRLALQSAMLLNIFFC